MERIKCAAIWYKHLKPTHEEKLENPSNIEEGLVVLGHRHADIILNVYNLTGLRSSSLGQKATGPSQQGFVTNLDRFVNREEAALIAVKAGQIKDFNEFDPSRLFSEDIY